MDTRDETPSVSAIAQALELLGAGYWEWSPASDELKIAPGFPPLLEHPHDRLPGRTADWLPLVHPEDRGRFSALLAQAASAADSTSAKAEIRLRHGSGSWHWLSVHTRALPGPRRNRDVLIVFQDITGHKQVEAALRDNQLRYRALYSTSPLAFILWDREGRISEWNKRAESLFGWRAEEVIGKQVQRLLLPAEARESFQQTIQALVQHRGDGSFSGRCLGKDGLSRTCNWHNVALRTHHGTLFGILSLLLDVTAERNILDKLTRSEKVYRTLVETSPDAILLVDLQGRVQTANQRSHQLFGLDEMEVTGFHISQLLPGAGQGTRLPELLANPDDYTGFIVTRELDLCRRDGTAFPAAVAFTTVIASDGRPSGIVFFARDITDTRQRTEELEQHRLHLEEMVLERTRDLETARENLAKIIDGSPVPTFVLDANHVVTHWNRACERIIGTPAGRMIGTCNQWQAFYPEPRPVMADLVISGELDQVEHFYSGKFRHSQVIEDGVEGEDHFPAFNRWLFFTAAPLKDRNGHVIGAIETLQDVSERKQAEIALLEAKRLAEAAANAKADFLANMSHEIRTPMNAVIGLAYLLLKTELTDKQRDQVLRIQGAGKMLLGLINDVLDFSKIEAGSMHLEHSPFTLDQVLDDVASVVLHRAQEKGLELNYVLEPSVPGQLIGDPLRLAQILINLVGNAIKFTARGSVTVFVRASPDGSGSLLEFNIQDTGIGMTAEQQQALFRAFSQGDTSITRKYGGTGLGLTICKRLVEMMAGEIWVTSEAGQGSTFSFTIRLETGGPATSVPPASGLRVLVVDDNALARTVLSRLLEKFGCRTETAASGEAALELLRQPRKPGYDCITLDLNMPGLDGLEVANIIRAEVTPLPRLVMVTATDTHSLDDSTSLDRFDAILHKPLTAAQVGKLVERLLDGGQQAMAAGSAAPQAAVLAGMRILLAEDIPTNQLIARETLQAQGATVDCASNGIEAIDKLSQRSNGYDVVLMDIQMPDMDGLEATRRIRANPLWRTLPIVAMTAHAIEAERQRCLAAGMNDFVTKPFDPDKLAALLLRLRAPLVAGNGHAPQTAAQEAGPPQPEGIPSLPGIDTREGLRRMMNKPALYTRILKDFHQRFRDEPQQIRQAMAAGDRETAQRRAHTTKGLAGSIGAAALQIAAVDLEKAIAGANADTDACLDRFEQAMNVVIDGIRAGFALDGSGSSN